MLTYFWKVALRNFLKNSLYSSINVIGLSIGIASSILILLWVADEYNYDRFHKKYDRIYQLYKTESWAQGIGTGQSMPYLLKDELLTNSSQIKSAVMTNWGEGNMLQVGDKRLNKFGLSATEDFLKVFSFEVVKGDPTTALSDPTSIVITESTADLFFKDQDPINQLIKIDNKREQKVTAVIKDVPLQSSLTFDYVLPFGFFEATQSWVRYAKSNWNNNSFQIYVELQEKAKQEEVESSIKDIVKNNNPKAQTAVLFLHPMSKWRLYSKFENGINTGGLIEYVRLFTAIAVFVLIIACINFMNLATARSESRAREVGIRKSIGSGRKELIFQFLGESVLITALSTLIAIAIVQLVLPYYNLLVEKQVMLEMSNPWVWGTGITWILVIGIFSGSYPAFYLSSFQPVKVLKGKISSGKGTTTPRKVLVILQFGFSIFLIIGTIVIYQQIKHVKNRELGYNRENLIQMWTNNELEKNFNVIRQELVTTGSVVSVTKSNSPITSIFSSNEVEWPGMPADQRVALAAIATEYDYTKTMGIKMLQGRDFSRDHKSDSAAVILNEAAVEMMGLEDPLGQRIKFNSQDVEIIGIVPNVIMGSPYTPVEACGIVFDPTWVSTITIRMSETKDLNESLAAVESVFKKYNPSYPFEYRFVDADFQKKFTGINLVSRLASIFASLAIVITCLGLFGLAAFTAEQRTKEVGIRKVLGASAASLVALISRDFSRLVIISFFIAAPVAWVLLGNYLEQYPYRVSIAWWVLPLAGLSTLLMALLIVGTQAAKAAAANPTNSLRSE